MNFEWSRFLRSIYRKEPIASFIITVGVVDIAIGGIDESWSLMTLGLGTVGVAIAFRWWQMQQRIPLESTDRVPTHYLPPRSSRPQLPMLSVSKKNPPN